MCCKIFMQTPSVTTSMTSSRAESRRWLKTTRSENYKFLILKTCWEFFHGFSNGCSPRNTSAIGSSSITTSKDKILELQSDIYDPFSLITIFQYIKILVICRSTSLCSDSPGSTLSTDPNDKSRSSDSLSTTYYFLSCSQIPRFPPSPSRHSLILWRPQLLKFWAHWWNNFFSSSFFPEFFFSPRY